MQISRPGREQTIKLQDVVIMSLLNIHIPDIQLLSDGKPFYVFHVVLMLHYGHTEILHSHKI